VSRDSLITLSGASLVKVDRSSARYSYLREVHQRIARKDAMTWGQDASAEASIRLNWVDLPESSIALAPTMDAILAKFQHCNRVVLCGMGGSSLAPEVLSKSFKRPIFIVDSTDPHYIAHALDGDLATTLFVVSSKSGSTIETSSQRAFFQDQIRKAGLSPTDHILFVTDPASPLDISVREEGFAVVNADPNVGGRFSALSAFGVVPATLAGIDMWEILREASACKSAFLNNDEQIIDVAYLLSEVAGQYLSFADQGSDVPGLSDWIEQLIAESTGKDGRGRLPIVCEDIESSRVGGAFSIAFSNAGADLNVIAPLGAHFIFWEWVTALIGAALEIDPFNQPNVTEAKEQTLALLNEWKGTDSTSVPDLTADSIDGSVEIFGNGESLTESLRTVIAAVSEDGYIAIMAYLDRDNDRELEELRSILSAKSQRPVTFGWGPRFMHSTGQFHKAGQPNGTFIQVTGAITTDFEIPGREFTFGTLVTAQALGDGRALAKRKYPLLRLNCLDRRAGISEILAAAKAI
jgi:glucose-6-phosphate isomerase